ncbi:MAG: tripartite tricarboxylate transporter substrate binding protein [Burkholderiales bacterium]|nr:tripartite tricarboxylate transporter substrate binding protein [Burkholderiales bacterium]
MPLSSNRRRWLQSVTVGSLSLPILTQAQETYPTKPIRIIVPLPSGGAVDVGIRILTEQLQTLLKQPLVVDNKPGGVFQIGMQALAQSPADGYTLLATNTSFVTAQLLLNRYDMLKQLTPISTWSQVDVIITASPSAPFTTLRDMVAWAKANPGRLTYGSVGPGTIEHLLLANFAKKYGFSATHVPFKGGPDAMATLAGGDIHVFSAVIPLVNQFKTRVRPMAVMSDRRTPSFPEVPTLKEAGIDLAPFQFWNGLHAPAGTPPAVIDALQRAIGQALKTETAQTKYAGIGMIPSGSSAAQFSAVVNDDFRWLADAIRDADVKLN